MSPRTATRRRPPGALREVRERCAHRDGVRVVGVVDQQAAARERDLLEAPARELDLHALGPRQPERVERRQGRRRVRGLVARAEVEADAAEERAVRPRPRPSGSREPDELRCRRARPGSSYGTIAVPPGGSAATSSLFARSTPSSEPTSSRCAGPTFVIDADLRPRDPQSSAIWPKPRIASSTMQTSVSGSSRQSVSGTPISLL